MTSSDDPQMLTGQTMVVTGASSGIGAEAARQLHRLGATVVPVGRSKDRTATLAAEIGAEPLLADFSRLDDVHRLAERLGELDRIDVLVNNAGGRWNRAEITGDGYERTFQTNHLAPYLLTRLLQAKLVEAKARVVTTSSAAHRMGRLNPADLDSSRRFGANSAYGRSKLANILFAAELQRRWGPLGVTSTSLHPGVVATEFGRDGGAMKLVYSLGTRFMVTPADGGRGLVWLASTPASDNWTPGGYHVRFRPAPVSKAGRDPELAKMLWDRSAEMVGLQP